MRNFFNLIRNKTYNKIDDIQSLNDSKQKILSNINTKFKKYKLDIFSNSYDTFTKDFYIKDKHYSKKYSKNVDDYNLNYYEQKIKEEQKTNPTIHTTNFECYILMYEVYKVYKPQCSLPIEKHRFWFYDLDNKRIFFHDFSTWPIPLFRLGNLIKVEINDYYEYLPLQIQDKQNLPLNENINKLKSIIQELSNQELDEVTISVLEQSKQQMKVYINRYVAGNYQYVNAITTIKDLRNIVEDEQNLSVFEYYNKYNKLLEKNRDEIEYNIKSQKEKKELESKQLEENRKIEEQKKKEEDLQKLIKRKEELLR